MTKKKTKEKEKETPSQVAEKQPVQESSFVDPYNYEFLLKRIELILKQNNPQLAERAKFIMKPPEVGKLGGKRVAWVNFAQNCASMKRPPEHVQHFFLTELGTEGSMAGDGEQLILKGKYNSKHIESLIKKYISEYVCCQLCKSPNTLMIKDTNTRLYMLKCESCHSTRSVQSIKAGFQALRQGDRKKEKNK